MVMLGT